MTDYHGACKSGSRIENLVWKKLKGFGYTIITTQKDVAQYHGFQLTKGGNVKRKDVPFCREYLEGRRKLPIPPNKGYDKFKENFLSDGFSPELNAFFEIKGGLIDGTADEKIMADIGKIKDGVYGDYHLFYIFQGIMEENKWTHKFIFDLNELKESGNIYAQTVTVLMFSELTKETLEEICPLT